MRAAIDTLRENETESGRNGIFVLARMVISLIKIIIMDKNIMRALPPFHTHTIVRAQLIAFDSIGISIVCYLGCRC